ncbi:PREDICTED: uncharacterized protein LOC109338290 [Lupinus angustifolius]|uniref:uncharacterized protein LOC109338290 n=1 Tax=Lupinus angustifolius TaxID=3871 RepID=UPI00092F6750|nr:PREDICTED: uncharacterized protein LOC109338290 [Lupinus angustifolius]
MARSNDDWEQEKEEMRARFDVNDARMRKTEDLLAAIAAKLGISSEGHGGDEGSEFGGGDRADSSRRSNEQWRRLEIPVFVGEDAFGWTRRLERYFSLKRVNENEKMQATVLALEGKAMSWFQWWEKCNPNPSWEGFKIAVIRRFQPSMIQNPFELLLSVKQTGTVEDYVEEFEKYVGALREIDQEFAKGIFLNGLREEVQAEVRLFELQTLTAVIQKAIMIEQKNIIVNKKGATSYSRTTGFQRNNSFNKVVTVDTKGSTGRNYDVSTSSGDKSSVGSANVMEASRARGGGFKQLSGAEMREKREKGLCFRCDEPYHRDHRCKNKQLKMLILEEDEDSEGEGQEEPRMEEFSALQLSLCSMAGLTSAKSWKVAGKVEAEGVVVLIDCGEGGSRGGGSAH